MHINDTIDPSTMPWGERVKFFERQIATPRPRKPPKPSSGEGGKLLLFIIGGIVGYLLMGMVGFVPFLLICAVLRMSTR
jgi:hypothetical protein